MFPKETFTREDKKKAKSHWTEFSKYLDYQNQQGTIPRDLAHLPEIKAMFKLTLQEIALGWFETKSPTWQTEDQMKQVFLKRFNPWGDTRRQQQDAWNKLKFDITKDDVDAFIVAMKMLASILGHQDDVIMEKFKDIFPEILHRNKHTERMVNMQGLSVPIACVASGDPVRVLHLYTTNTLDEV